MTFESFDVATHVFIYIAGFIGILSIILLYY
jgi:hypothetical protein